MATSQPPLGGVILEAGNSIAYDTGTWRSLRPVIDMSRCIHCMICWIFCPDSALPVQGGCLLGVDLAHCKGCGICARECPRRCIGMVEESTLRERG